MVPYYDCQSEWWITIALRNDLGSDYKYQWHWRIIINMTTPYDLICGCQWERWIIIALINDLHLIKHDETWLQVSVRVASNHNVEKRWPHLLNINKSDRWWSGFSMDYRNLPQSVRVASNHNVEKRWPHLLNINKSDRWWSVFCTDYHILIASMFRNVST